MRKDIIFTTWHSNDKLYEMMSSFIDANVIPLEVDMALRYLVTILSFNWGNIKWLVHLDEDAFVFDLDKLYNLIDYMEANEYDVAGMPDGGVISMRDFNPLSINPFFSIYNFRKINDILIRISNLSMDTAGLEEYLPSHRFKKNVGYNYNDKSESYYALFFTLLREGCKFLWLDAETCTDDNISTYLKDQNLEPFLIHTWYARNYNSEITEDTYPRNNIKLALSKQYNSQRINSVFRNHLTKELALEKSYKYQ